MPLIEAHIFFSLYVKAHLHKDKKSSEIAAALQGLNAGLG